MIKKLLFILVVFVVGGTGVSTFSYFEKSVYCHLSKDKILISLKPDGFLCSSYIRSLEIKMRTTFKNITVIQGYIDQGKDLGYWKPLKDDKVILLNKYQNLRLDIISRIEDFEKNLLITSKKYFLENMADYQRKLLRSKAVLLNFSSSLERNGHLLQLQEALDVFDDIADAQTFVQLNALIQRHVYLKQQILGK